MRNDERPLREGIAYHENGDDSFLYVPGEVLVAAEDAEAAKRVLDGVAELTDQVEQLAVVRFRAGDDVPALVEKLRGSGIRSGPNHVLSGEPRYKGGPAGPVARAETDGREPCGEAGAGVTVAVIDTGYTDRIHPWLDARVVPDGPVDEALDALPADGRLDSESGHGTFIAGIIAAQAPGAQIVAARVLWSDGWGDELTIATAIRDLASKAQVLNLSLGGYTQGNVPPVGLERALVKVPRTSAVVAAAGNAGSQVPFWPAAFKGVYGVAAVDAAGARPAFSNSGAWVDCAAPGVDIVSTFPLWKPGGIDGWATWSGTSFAAPWVAGAIAAEMTANGGSAADAVHRLLAAAKRRDPDLGAILV